MFAVFEDGSRQYRVQPGDLVVIDYRADASAEQQLTFDKVLLANGGGPSVIGVPTIPGATITAKVTNPLWRGPKLEIQKLRRRHASKRHTGHRQKHTQVEVVGINVPNLQVVAPAAQPAAN